MALFGSPADSVNAVRRVVAQAQVSNTLKSQLSLQYMPFLLKYSFAAETYIQLILLLLDYLQLAVTNNSHHAECRLNQLSECQHSVRRKRVVS
jgi:hypothetical protein